MICAIDIETKGLDATKFVLGTLWKDNCNKPEVFFEKEKLWNRLIELGKKEKARKRLLSVYAHNHQFDFYGYANLEEKGLKFPSHDHPTSQATY